MATIERSQRKVGFTPRVVEVARLKLGRPGIRDKEVAAILGITAKTAFYHWERARRAISAGSRWLQTLA